MTEAIKTHQSIEALPIDRIFTSPHQMRKQFDPSAIRDLAQSMQQEGLIQPITVRKVGGAFELVVGERRLRAARLLKWQEIEARVIDISDEDAAVKGLIENLQRTDLSSIEEARGYKQLVDPPYNLTQEAIAQRVGKSQTAIARSLALLDLPPEIQALMPRGILTESHTRSIRKVSSGALQLKLARQADRQGWTVKETERQVSEVLKLSGEPLKKREGKPKTLAEDPHEKIWSPIMRMAGDKGVRMSAVDFKGPGRWTLHVEASGSTPSRRALADFFMRLGHLLNGPLPSDLREDSESAPKD